MLETLGIVQLYPGNLSSAAAQRREALLMRQLAGKTMLEWIIRRTTEAQRLDGVIVLTGDSPLEQRLIQQTPADVPVCVCDAADALAACAKAIEKFPARAVVLVATDAPFVDPTVIDRLVITAAEHPECDYVSYRHGDGRPTVLSDVGVFAEWCKSDAIRRANRKASAASQRQAATQFLYSHPDVFQLRLLPLPAELDRRDLRLRVTCEEDWDNATAILDALGPDALEWQRITSLLEQQPALRERMATLNECGAALN